MRYYRERTDSRNLYWIGKHIYFVKYKNGKFASWIDAGRRYVLVGFFIWVLGINFLEREKK